MAAAGQRQPRASGNAIRALFGAAKNAICRKDAPAPQPRRRRRGDTGKSFAAACRKMLRRAPKRQAKTIGGHAAFVDLCASAGVFLSDTLDWLTLGEDAATHDHWHEEEFSATFEDYFPQP